LRKRSDKIRDYVLGDMMSDHACLDATVGPSEIPFVIGVITWALTPLYRRDKLYYFTPSRIAFATARVLRQLRFDVSSSEIEIGGVDVMNRLVRESRVVRDATFLFHGTASGIETDYDATHNYIQGAEPSRKPHIVAIRQIPHILFRHVLHAPFNLTVDQHRKLLEIRDKSFAAANQLSCVSSELPMFEEIIVRMFQRFGSGTKLSGFQQTLLNKLDVCSLLVPLLDSSSMTFLPAEQGDMNWDPARLSYYLENGRVIPGDDHVIFKSYVLKSVVLSSRMMLCLLRRPKFFCFGDWRILPT
jgi:hypothetical protein